MKAVLKRYLIVAWSAGMVSFILAMLFSMGFFQVGAVLGLINTGSAPCPNYFGKGQKIIKVNQVFHFFINLAFAIALSYVVARGFHLAYADFEDIELEPITFGLIYSFFHVIIAAVANKIWFFVKAKYLILRKR